ncbi:MAG: hypothetical protein Q9209_006558 [Squamulea sp. 1 TL-2023]
MATIANQMLSLADRTEPQSETAMLQELAAIKQGAMFQAEVISTEALEYLSTKGYTLKDLGIWGWILSGATAEEAALRLEIVRRSQLKAANDLGPVPIFIFQTLLSRTDINAESLSVLIRQIWQLLDSNDLNRGHSCNIGRIPTRKSIGPVGLDVFTTLVVRLLRHVRKVWPAVITNIAELWVAYAKGGTDTSRLSFHYNRILQIMALPPNESPYQSLQHRQAAQVVLLGRMTTSSPKLTINREGFRAIAQVQLAHPKTPDEQTWAQLKAKSWPPWKADKDGMDAGIGPEHGVSQATMVLRKAAERGYGSEIWEKSAGILAGWDTDHSPTIQTRSAVVPLRLSSLPQGAVSLAHLDRTGISDHTTKSIQPEAGAIWVARIMATRTLQEAWVCFLACKDQSIVLTSQLYQEMFQKVIYDEKRSQGTSDDLDMLPHVGASPQQIPMPGDGKEVTESSASHNQAVSTRQPLPTIDSLIEQMVHDNVRPSSRLLELLLTHAQSYCEGVQVLEVSTLHDSVKSILLQGQRWDQARIMEYKGWLKTLPDWLFAAYINFLCRFAEPAPTDGDECNQRRFEHAFRLVITRLPMYRPPWNALLNSLSKHSSTVIGDKGLHLQTHVVKFDRAWRLLGCMDSLHLDMDFTGLGSLCAIVSNANARTLASAKHFKNDPDNDTKSRLEIVKTRFATLVQPSYDLHRQPGTEARLTDYCCSDSCDKDRPAIPGNDRSALPRLFRVPHPAHLHVYIRCLGYHNDFNGLVDLMRWLTVFTREVIEEAKEVANGRLMFKRCLMALRAWGCNGGLVSVEEERQRYESALVGLHKVLDGRDDWDSRVEWPTDEDVDDYIEKGESSTKLR